MNIGSFAFQGVRFDFHRSGLCGAGILGSRSSGRLHALSSDVCTVSQPRAAGRPEPRPRGSLPAHRRLILFGIGVFGDPGDHPAPPLFFFLKAPPLRFSAAQILADTGSLWRRCQWSILLLLLLLLHLAHAVVELL